jgi:hypothetical protein
MPREGAAPNVRKRQFYIETSVVTGPSAFADDDSRESYHPFSSVRSASTIGFGRLMVS